MPRIEKKDIDFGQAVQTVINNYCNKALTILLRECCDEGKLTSSSQCCSLIIKDRTDRKVLYDGICPLRKIKWGIQQNFPYFLSQWRIVYSNIYNRQKEVFSSISLIGIGVLFSVNNQRVPTEITPLAETFVSKYRGRPDNFSSEEITGELHELNRDWLPGLYVLACNQGVNNYTWGKVIFLLGLFLEMMKPIEEPTEKEKVKLFEAIKLHLASNPA